MNVSSWLPHLSVYLGRLNKEETYLVLNRHAGTAYGGGRCLLPLPRWWGGKMMAPPSASLAAPFLQFFFAGHLIAHRRVSPETVASYRDTFRMLLQLLQCSVGQEPPRLTFADMQAPSILQFLDRRLRADPECAARRHPLFFPFGGLTRSWQYRYGRTHTGDSGQALGSPTGGLSDPS